MNFKKPTQSEYISIKNLINVADQKYKEFYSEEEFYNHKFWTENIDSLIAWESKKEYICIYDDNDIMLWYSSYYLKNFQTLWISMIYTDTSSQNIWIWTQLIKYIENIAKSKNTLVVALETDKKAYWSVNFYKKNNYKILSDDDMTIYPYDQILTKKQIDWRYIFGKIL